MGHPSREMGIVATGESLNLTQTGRGDPQTLLPPQQQPAYSAVTLFVPRILPRVEFVV